MSKDLEKAFLEQGRRLFELCRLYIDGGLNPEEKDSLTKEIEDAFDKWEEIDNRALFDEITANLEEPMSEQHRKRYCFSLITPFGEYSSTTNPKWLIGKMQESIDSWQGDESARYKIETYKKQIEKANKKADKYLDIIKPIQRGEVANVLCEFAQIVYEYGILLDAAFVVHGLDLKQLQEKCGVWIRHFPIDELRVLDISYYVGSEALAEEYLSRLPQEQPEPQQEQGNDQQEQQKETQQAVAPEDNQEPQQILTINNTTKEKTVFGRALVKEYMELINGCYKWKKTKSLLAYMCGRLYCGDRVIVDESDYSEELIKGKSQLPRQELQQLFNVDVGNNRDQLKAPPRKYSLIDSLFKG